MPRSLLLSLIRNNGFVCCPSRTNFYVNSVIPCKGFLLDSESCKDFYRRAMDLPHYFSCYIVIHGLFELQLFLGFPGGSGGKETACYVGDPASIPGSGRSPGEGYGYPLQYSCLENSMYRGLWWATVHGITRGWTQPSD